MIVMDDDDDDNEIHLSPGVWPNDGHEMVFDQYKDI
jgi:hypothetical protein